MEFEIDEDIKDLFSYHGADEQQQKQFTEISLALMYAAQVIRNNAPACADQTLALQHLRDARMRANSAVALRGRGFSPQLRQR